MSNFLFSGRPTRKSGSRRPNQNEGICIRCNKTFNIKTLKMNDGKRCSRCYDKHLHSKGENVYTNPNNYGFYKMNKDVNRDAIESELLSDIDEESDESEPDNDDESEADDDDESEADNDDESEADDDDESEADDYDESETEYDGDNLTKMEEAIEQPRKRRRYN